MSGFKIDTRGLARGLGQEAERRAYGIEAIGRTEAARMENEAKATHPWTNRTGEAERRIAGRVERRGDLTRITLSSGVHYGVYLELAMGKRFAILWPTIKRHATEVLDAIRRIGGGR